MREIKHKFLRVIPDKLNQPSDYIWNLVGMIYHMTNTKEWMTAYEVQAELLKYYSGDNYDLFDVAELSLSFVEACLYLCCSHGLMKMTEYE